MVFSSTVFLLIFLPALLILYYLPIKKGTARRNWRNAVLLVFSIGFYAWGEPLFVFLMLISIVINWAMTIVMDRSKSHRKLLLSAIIIFDVLLLVAFKYASFISKNLASVTGNDNATSNIKDNLRTFKFEDDNGSLRTCSSKY